jgi:hypothetical protein
VTPDRDVSDDGDRYFEVRGGYSGAVDWLVSYVCEGFWKVAEESTESTGMTTSMVSTLLWPGWSAKTMLRDWADLRSLNLTTPVGEEGAAGSESNEAEVPPWDKESVLFTED